MPPGMKAAQPKNDSEYLERMSKAIFSSGLNWKMIENKWPNFRSAFAGFAPETVAGIKEKKIRELMKDSGIVRNERKIRATVHNAQAVLAIRKEKGSFKRYLDSFGRDEQALQKDLQTRFQHLGPSSARIFLWGVGYPLTPNEEEKSWIEKQGA
jgi:3-methyladenine DNA glycosylase Tag